MNEIDFVFFISLVSGIGFSFILLSNLINYLLKTQTVYIYSFFIGLILASAYLLYQDLENKNFKLTFVLVIGIVISFIFVGLNPIANNHDVFTIFLAGSIAICAMILPGISGSMILLLLSQYDYMIYALHSFNIKDISVFIFGAFVGILGFSKILNYLLKKYKNTTISLLIGVMIGTLRKPTHEIMTHLTMPMYYCIIPAILSFMLILILERILIKRAI